MRLPEGVTPDVGNYLRKKDPVSNRPVEKPWIDRPIPLFQIRDLLAESSPEKDTLGDVAREIAEISGTWNPVELLTPTNLQSERQKFFDALEDGEVYNPQFTYAVPSTLTSEISQQRLQSLQTHIREMKPGRNDRLRRIARVALDYKIRDDLATMTIAKALASDVLPRVKDATVKQALTQKYPGTDDTLVKAARRDFAKRITVPSEKDKQQGELTEEERDYLENTEFDAYDLKQAIEWVLDQYGILKTDADQEVTGFNVVLDPTVTATDVRDKSTQGPTVFIPADKKANGIKLLKLLGHEVEGHARQSVNGQILFGLGGGSLKMDDEMLYEGLGKRYDDLISRTLTGKDTDTALPVYAYAVKAAEEGHSFFEIYHQQLHMYLQMAMHIADPVQLHPFAEIDQDKLAKAKDMAWRRTYRVMRGHTDTTNREGYAMAKDLAYKRGELIDQQLRETDNGYLNETGVIASGALQLLAEFSISEADLPLPYQGAAIRYWHEVLKPRMQKERDV